MLIKDLKKLRKDSGLSQSELAEQLHISRQAISNWENDKAEPDLENLVRLAEILGVSVDSLIGPSKSQNTHLSRTTVGTEPPSNPRAGDVWIEPIDNKNND